MGRMGNHPSKYQLAGVRRFGGVRQQTNRQIHSLTDKCFYKVKNIQVILLFCSLAVSYSDAQVIKKEYCQSINACKDPVSSLICLIQELKDI